MWSAEGAAESLAVDGEYLGVCGGIAEAIKIPKRPDDSFFAGDFDELGVAGPCVAIIDQDISGREYLEGGDPCQLDAGEFILVEAPDDLAGGCDFDDGVSIAGADECVAILQAECAEDLISEGIDTVSGSAFAAEQRDLIFPRGGAIRTVFADEAFGFMADEKIAILEGTDESGIVVGVRLCDLERDSGLYGVIRGEEEESGGAGFGDECVAVGRSLEGVNFDASRLVIGLAGRIVFPDDFSGVGAEFGDVGPVQLEEDVA
ncbi:MAG: hypothetical protein RLZZ436_844 [Planctomycetota bacterium]